MKDILFCVVMLVRVVPLLIVIYFMPAVGVYMGVVLIILAVWVALLLGGPGVKERIDVWRFEKDVQRKRNADFWGRL